MAPAISTSHRTTASIDHHRAGEMYAGPRPANHVRDVPSNNVRTLKTFVARVNTDLKRLQVRASTADWIKNTFITDDTERSAAAANDDLLGYLSGAVKDAARFAPVASDPDTKRMLHLLRVSSALAAPSDPPSRIELTTLDAPPLRATALISGNHPSPPDLCSDVSDACRTR